MPNIFFQPELDLRDVVETTIFTIRHAADQIRQFDHGAIALRFVPKCDSAYDWLGCYRDKKDGDTDVDFVYSVKPGESKTRPAGWRGNPNNLGVACAGYAMQKIEGCARALVNGYGRCSDDLPDELAIPGTCNSRGGLCYDILSPSGGLWMRVYVAVSGATGDEDKWCAAIATNAALEQCFQAIHACRIVAPSNYDPTTVDLPN